MNISRRELFKLAGTGAVALAAVGNATAALAQAAAPTPIDYGNASGAEAELKIVLLEAEAKQILPPGRFAFMGAAGDGWTYRENRRAFNDFPIMPRRLQGVSAEAIDLRTTLMGHDLPFPMITCPVGAQGMIHVNAEVASAGGTGMAGTLYVSSGAATKPMEDIAKATPGPKWFQIYMIKDMEINRWLVQRAKAAGFSAIVLTADALGPGQSDDFIRLGRPFPPKTCGRATTTPRSVAMESSPTRNATLASATSASCTKPPAFPSSSRASFIHKMSGNAWPPARPVSGFPTTVAGRWTAFRVRSACCGRRSTRSRAACQ
jgi:L-lactate oxidase